MSNSNLDRVNPDVHPAWPVIVGYPHWYKRNIRQYRGDFSFCLDEDNMLPHQDLQIQPIRDEYNGLCHALNISLDSSNYQQNGKLSKESWLYELLLKIIQQLQRELTDLLNEDKDYIAQVAFLATSQTFPDDEDRQQQDRSSRLVG